MSIVAEFASELHKTFPNRQTRELRPFSYPSSEERLRDVQVFIFDVYGTLFNYWKPEFGLETTKSQALLEAFRKTISYFGMGPYLLEMDPGTPAEKTLWDLYHGLITIKQNLLIEKEIEFPEIKIEDVWTAILLMLKRHGYAFTQKDLGSETQLAQCMAYYYNFNAFNRGLYPGVSDALRALKKKNMRCGIVSNAQFYTPMDLTLFLRDQTDDAIVDQGELFDPDLVFYSFEYSVAKPSTVLFRKLFDALYEYQVLPSQTVFVGNDLAADIKPAKEAGMKTALFTGDDQSAFTHGLEQSIIPDISFTTWDNLVERVSFYEK
jgi:Predicted hydrolase (HAD superfamily)